MMSKLMSIRIAVGTTCVVAGLLLGAAPALAVPIWQIAAQVAPTHIPPGGEGTLEFSLTNLGYTTAEGAVSPMTFTDVLPAGLTATEISGEEDGNGEGMPCVLSPALSCSFDGPVPPYGVWRVRIHVLADQQASGSVVDRASLSGGGARSVSISEPVTISSTPAGFGVEKLEMVAYNRDGSVDTQAGSHPFELTTTFTLNDGPFVVAPGRLPPGEAEPVKQAKDLHFKLPTGLVGNVTIIPQCSEEQFRTPVDQIAAGCPSSTAIGVSTVTLEDYFQHEYIIQVPLFNLVPAPGEPARFGFEVGGVWVYLETSVRTGGDYGVTVNVNNITQSIAFEGSQVTIWGVPADSAHNESRGDGCLPDVFAGNGLGPCEGSVQLPSTPFLTLPTSCGEPWKASVLADSWEAPSNLLSGEYSLHDENGAPVGLDGCNRLRFEPSINVAPDGQAGSTPTGLTVGVHVPQESTLTPTGLAEADVKDTTVALPAGVQLSPSAADGLLACSSEEIGFEGVDPQSGLDLFSPAVPSCPEASKVATVSIKSPLLPNELKGAVYLAAQNANPFGSLVALYIVAQDPLSGVLVKLPGEVKLDEHTGQIVTTFQNTPQLPFEDLHLEFFGGSRAPLSTPPLCGSYTTKASIAPWSGNPPAEPSSRFEITSAANGAPCSNPQPFTPGFEAGSLNLQAAAFTPFTLTMSRPDVDQTLSRVEMQMPPGLLGTLSTVKLCPEPQAQAGTCGEESLIGHTIVSAGLGGDPYTVTGGKVFITGPYKGAPYGLSIVNPAKAGPFDLGTVIVRATIEVDPHTAALSIKSDPLPTILDGIPLQIQHVNVTVEHPGGFTFNPSNCGKLQITGTLSSTEGAAASVSTPFQVTNCATLAFKPTFSVSTSGKTSRANGASLHVKLAYTPGPFDANIARVKVELPKQLPSRLSTLQKACAAAVFEANPANCPPASLIGSARARTPVLPVPLTGPAYFVSHGGEAFPSLIVVLQGYGVTVDLVGSTFISKQGITSSTFKTVPDVPVGSFELTLPEGKYSALAANNDLCKDKLAMPTEFAGQNGALLKQSTKIQVTGCPKAKRKGRAKKTKGRGHHAKAGGKAKGKSKRGK